MMDPIPAVGYISNAVQITNQTIPYMVDDTDTSSSANIYKLFGYNTTGQWNIMHTYRNSNGILVNEIAVGLWANRGSLTYHPVYQSPKGA